MDEVDIFDYEYEMSMGRDAINEMAINEATKYNSNKGRYLMQAQGYIQKISTKQGQGRNGPYTIYSMNVDGEWYSCGFKPINANEGDYVSFNVIKKENFTNAENIKLAAGAQPQAAPQQAAAPSGPLPVNKKDVSIHFQSCRKDAIQTLSVLLQHEAVKLPAKQADKMDSAMALLDELTARYYLKLEDVINNGGVSEEDLVPPTGGE